MILVQAMPDELSVAHAGRFGSLNRLPTYRVQSALCAALMAYGQEVDGLTMMEMLALASGISSNAYAQAHSMIPALRVATKGSAIRPHGDPEDRACIRRLGMMAPREGGFVCLECLKVDLAGFGFSWFRRVHHLIGVDWCIHHGERLWQVATSAPFSALPHVWKARGLLRELDGCARRLDEAEPFLQRFAAISATLLTLTQPMSTSHLHPILRERATDLGLRRAMVGKQPPLSDRVRELAPKRWIQAHVPGLNEKPVAAYMSRIDDQLTSLTPAAGDSYALAMAALFPSTDEAFEAVFASSQNLPSMVPSSRQVRGVQFWHGEIWQHYTRHKGDHRGMAEDIGLPANYVTQRLLTLGLPDLKEIGSSPLGAALNTFAGGASLEQACASHLVDVQDLQVLLRVACARLAKAVEQIARDSGKPSLRRYRGLTSSNNFNFLGQDENDQAPNDAFNLDPSAMGHASIG